MDRFYRGFGLVGLVAMACPAMAAPPRLSAAMVEDAGFAPLPDEPSGKAVPEVVKAEVLLGRAHISPGAIDGIDGDNFRKALAAYQRQVSLPETGRLDQGTWDKLSGDHAAAMRRYEITTADADGPFTRTIPARFEAQSRLKRLGYRDLKEALAERFHMSITLLVTLNSGGSLRAGRTIDVAAAEGPSNMAPVRIVVDKRGHALEAFGADGAMLAFYPASIGSAEKPAPSGEFLIRRIVHNPDYTYLPQFAFKGVKSKTPFRIAPGPNNPVGTVWMDLSYEGYGIHGTPNPEAIGKTQSHGCIRLTNWDVENLAAMVQAGTPVLFQDGPAEPQPNPPATPVTRSGSGAAAASSGSGPDTK